MSCQRVSVVLNPVGRNIIQQAAHFASQFNEALLENGARISRETERLNIREGSKLVRIRFIPIVKAARHLLGQNTQVEIGAGGDIGEVPKDVTELLNNT